MSPVCCRLKSQGRAVKPMITSIYAILSYDFVAQTLSGDIFHCACCSCNSDDGILASRKFCCKSKGSDQKRKYEKLAHSAKRNCEGGVARKPRLFTRLIAACTMRLQLHTAAILSRGKVGRQNRAIKSQMWHHSYVRSVHTVCVAFRCGAVRCRTRHAAVYAECAMYRNHRTTP